MVVLVCGSRDWTAWGPIRQELGRLPPASVLVHGDCRGADRIAAEVALDLGFSVRDYPVSPADWKKLGLAAGPTRNKHMLDEQIRIGEPVELGLAFHEDFAHSKGTKGMVELFKTYRVPYRLFGPEGLAFAKGVPHFPR